MQLFETKSDLKIKIQALQKDFFFKTEIVTCRYINCKYNCIKLILNINILIYLYLIYKICNLFF